MVKEYGQPQSKKRRISSKLFNLPSEVIDRIIYYLPDDCLENCIDLPLIGNYALNRLYAYIEIISSYTLCWEDMGPKGYESFSSLKRYQSLPSFLFQVNNCSYKAWRVNDFVQFTKSRTEFRPKVVHFVLVEQLGWLYKRYPHLLNQLPRIDLSFGLTIQRVCDIPKEYVRKILDNKITDDFLVNLIKQGWGENVKVLELLGPSLENLPSLFPNLQRLRFVRIDLSESPLPPLPLSLEFLQLFTDDFDKLDVSYLENLKEIVFDCFNPLNRLDRFKFPLGIERVRMMGSIGDDFKINIESLDSIEQYTNLKEFRIEHGELCEKTKIFSKRTNFPDNLQNLEITFFHLCTNAEPWEPLGTVRGNLSLPNNLRALLLRTFQIHYTPKLLIFPESLRALSIVNERTGMEKIWQRKGYAKEDWSVTRFPSSLVELHLLLDTIDGITFPKSLQKMTLKNRVSLKSVNFLELGNLVQLKLDWSDTEELVCIFPSTLKIFEVNQYWKLKKSQD